jgi:hypothetical protein
MRMKKICLAIILLTGACTKDLTRISRPEAIVQACLLPHQQVSVRISREIPWGNGRDTLLPLEGLSPVLVQNHVAHPLTYMGKGLYGNPNISLQEKDSCHLYFQYNDQEVSAHTVIPGRPTGFTCNTDTMRRFTGGSIPQALEFKWNNPGNDYHMVIMQLEGAQPWWVRPVNPFTIRPEPLFTAPTKETIAWVSNPNMFYPTARYQLLLLRILPEYAVIFKEENNNSLNITNPPNNIINGYGIFTGISISDTLLLDLVE